MENKGDAIDFTPEKEKPIILKNHELKEYTTFRIGGKADYFAEPRSLKELAELLKWCNQNNISYFILGHGSNILFTDKGYRGMIIYLGQYFSEISHQGNHIIAGAGALLKEVSDLALEKSLDGMVFASGIPGSIGGAVYMNAGAYGGEMKEIVESVKVMDAKGNIKTYAGSEMNFGYRQSLIQETGEIILEVTLALNLGNQAYMKAYTKDLTQRRESKQPLDMPSAGSTFKRPEGYFAGKLIMDAGLAGYRCGGAAVSEKHCGFIVNVENATCADVISLIEYIQETVEKKFAVKMQPEVKIIGER